MKYSQRYGHQGAEFVLGTAGGYTAILQQQCCGKRSKHTTLRHLTGTYLMAVIMYWPSTETICVCTYLMAVIMY